MSVALERYIAEAFAQGCPRDQVENFVKCGQVLFPKQLKASALARLCDLPDGPEFLLFGGARGPGKSHWAIVQAAVDDCQRCPGLKVLLLRKIAKSAKEGFNDLRIRILSQVKHNYAENRGVLTFPNGSRIIIGHFQNEKDIDAYLGLEYDLIIVEEAGTLTKSKITAIRTCLRTSKPNWRPRMYLTTNPGGVGHADLKKQFVIPYRKGQEVGTRFVPATVDDNPVINPEYVKSQLDTLQGWMLKAWRHGDWDIMAGQFFINWHEDTHKIEPFAALPSTGEFYLSLDYGWTHYTACHLGMKYDGKRYVLDEYGARRTLPSDHVDGIHAMLDRNGLTWGDLRRKVAGHDLWTPDKEGKTIADTYEKLGMRFDKAMVDRINGAGELVTAMGEPFAEGTPKEPRLYIVDRCDKLIEQIPAMEHDPHRPEDVLKIDCDADTGEGGDDFYDSGRYLVMEMGKGRGGWAKNTKDLKAG